MFPKLRNGVSQRGWGAPPLKTNGRDYKPPPVSEISCLPDILLNPGRYTSEGFGQTGWIITTPLGHIGATAAFAVYQRGQMLHQIASLDAVGGRLRHTGHQHHFSVFYGG